MATLAEKLDRFLHAGAVPAAASPGHVLAFPGPRSPAATSVYVDQVLVPPERALRDSRLRPGCIVSLGDASGCGSVTWPGTTAGSGTTARRGTPA